MLEEGLSFLAAAHNKNRLKDELQKMQYLYNDHISGVKIEVQKLYSIKVVCHVHIMTITIALISSIIMTLCSPERRVGPHDEEPLWRLQGQH